MGDKSSEDGHGHRARLRARLLEGGPDSLLDHELVEYLLTLSIRRQDTKKLAWRLVEEFGSVGAVFSAEPDALARHGLSEPSIAAIKIAEAAALRLLSSRVVGRPVLASWGALLDYLRADMAHRAVERVRVLHLNTKNVLIRDDLVSEGSIDQAVVYVREIIRRAMELGSAAIILVHNHPSGDPSPSRADIALTRQVIEAGRPLGIAVHDHVIIAGEGHVSLRAQGLI